MPVMSALKGAEPPAQDDESWYSGSSYASDDYTLPGDDADDDARSIASASSHESYDSFCPRERLPSYRVPKDQGTSQPVYEAWILCMSHETGHEVTKVRSCGIDIMSSHDEERPFVVSRTETYEQQELSDMALASVSSYHAANKRGFAARLFRGKPKTYEQDLDERLRRLPLSLQSNLNGLLRNREEATSNRFRRRDWTVVMMREQYRYRFATAAPEPVKKKGKDPRRTEFLFVIRGSEGKVAADDRGMYRPREFGNPWKRVDEAERQMRERSRDIRRFGKEYVQQGWLPRPRGRSLSPSPNNAPGPVPPPFQDCPPPPRRPREVITVRDRGRPYSRSRSRSRSRSSQSRSRSRSPSYAPARNDCLPPMNPFVPLPMPMGGMPPLPPTPSPYHCPTPGRFVPPPYVPAGNNHLPPFVLPPFETPCTRRQPHDLGPEPFTWPQPLGVNPHLYAGGDPPPPPCRLPMPAPFPFEVSSPPQSPRASFHCMGGAGGPPPPPPPGIPTMEACHRLFDAEFMPEDEDNSSVDDESSVDDDSSVDSESYSQSAAADHPPPPPPKPSNLTTPTEFSPAASSHHTGSTMQSTDVTTPGGPGMEVFWDGVESPRPADRAFVVGA